MARPQISVAQAALDNLVSALTSGNTPVRVQRSGAAIDALSSVASVVRSSYLGTPITVTDTNDADLQAMFAHAQLGITIVDSQDADLEAACVAGGQIYDAFGRALRIGDTFTTVSTTADLTDNALATAKGGAVAVDDNFIVSNATATTFAVVYAGNDGELGLALGRKPQVGDVFQVAGTGDTTDNALAAAKLVTRPSTLDIVVTDLADATIAAFLLISGQPGVALGRALREGDIIQVGGAGDTTDNALQTAKGSAPADGDQFLVDAGDVTVTYLVPGAVAADIFEVTNVTIASEAVAYLGNAVIVTSGVNLGRGR